MSAKTRIKRAEKAIKPKEQIEFIWLEQDEDGNFPPVQPGTKVIELKWDVATNEEVRDERTDL